MSPLINDRKMSKTQLRTRCYRHLGNRIPGGTLAPVDAGPDPGVLLQPPGNPGGAFDDIEILGHNIGQSRIGPNSGKKIGFQIPFIGLFGFPDIDTAIGICLLYTSDAADE